MVPLLPAGAHRPPAPQLTHSTPHIPLYYSAPPCLHPQVVIGTHGKLRDWMQKRVLDVRSIRILVFDEADEMLKVRLGGGG